MCRATSTIFRSTQSLSLNYLSPLKPGRYRLRSVSAFIESQWLFLVTKSSSIETFVELVIRFVARNFCACGGSDRISTSPVLVVMIGMRRSKSLWQTSGLGCSNWLSNWLPQIAILGWMVSKNVFELVAQAAP